MRSSHLIVVAALSLAACSNATRTNAANATPDAAQQGLKWGPAPSVFPPGAELAVLEGDPSKSEPFTVRLRMPDGYKIPPHTHPTVENVTIVSGTFLAGMGTKWVDGDLQPFAQGAFASIPANHPHYAMARGQTIVQVHAIGPFALTYVNTADAPSQR